eukprot:m.376959 g.376959  ORF g.376959 m.376959 type:complete len:83 (-) comp16704_c1_seq1:67-315(-)
MKSENVPSLSNQRITGSFCSACVPSRIIIMEIHLNLRTTVTHGNSRNSPPEEYAPTRFNIYDGHEQKKKLSRVYFQRGKTRF